jgi:hypothetical protein
LGLLRARVVMWHSAQRCCPARSKCVQPLRAFDCARRVCSADSCAREEMRLKVAILF